MKLIKYILTVVLLAMAAVCVWVVTKRCSHADSAPTADSVRIDTAAVLLTRMQSVSRLHTAEVQVHKIITHDDNARLTGSILGKEMSVDLPIGTRKVAIPLFATIKASVDMSQLTPDDIVRTGDYIEIYLPHPQVVITETHVDHDGIRQYVALTRSRFTDEELQEYQRQGRETIERDLSTMNIEEMARENAARQLVPIIRAMGYDETKITISFRTDGKQNTTITRQRE